MKKTNRVKDADVIDFNNKVDEIKQRYYQDRDDFYGNYDNDDFDDGPEVDEDADLIDFTYIDDQMTMMELCAKGGKYDFSQIEI